MILSSMLAALPGRVNAGPVRPPGRVTSEERRVSAAALRRRTGTKGQTPREPISRNETHHGQAQSAVAVPEQRLDPAGQLSSVAFSPGPQSGKGTGGEEPPWKR